ncbi:MAG: hypothetical protein K1X82_11800 [Bacteroidia bacterium]|nr:hypothetical protein [Bacteroidia bacterium]
MLQLFKSGRAETYILLFIIGLLAWFPALNQTAFIEVPSKTMVGYTWLVSLFSQFRFLSLSLALLASFGGALLINGLNETFEMRSKANQLPALMYLLFIAVFPDDHRLNPALLGNLFLMGSWWFIFATYREDKCMNEIFLGFLLLSLGALVYFPLVFQFPGLLISLAVLRSFNWREWSVGFIAFLLPFVYLFSYYYLNDELYQKAYSIFVEGILDWVWDFKFTNSNILFILFTGILFLLSLLIHVSLMNTGKVKAQKYLTNVFFSLIISAIIVVFTQYWSNSATMMLVLPLSFMFANFFNQLASKFVGELLLWVMIAVVAVVKLQLLG